MVSVIAEYNPFVSNCTEAILSSVNIGKQIYATFTIFFHWSTPNVSLSLFVHLSKTVLLVISTLLLLKDRQLWLSTEQHAHVYEEVCIVKHWQKSYSIKIKYWLSKPITLLTLLWVHKMVRKREIFGVFLL